MDRLRRRLEHAFADRTTIKGFVECGASGDIRLQFERRFGYFGGRCLLHGGVYAPRIVGPIQLHFGGVSCVATRGRIYVDNINLCSDGGWKVFETHRAFSPTNRPPHMTQNSTPQEIETYLKRAGFSDVRIRTDDDWIRASGIKRNFSTNS